MISTSENAAKVAEFLLQAKAVKLSPKEPFTWASGWKSPIYCDNRITLSYPSIRTYIRQELVKVITHHYGRPDVIAGVATGGIAQGALVAQDLGLPFAYVRSAPKSHGMKNMVEGRIEEGQSVIVIEDLISTGGSSLNAVKALREVGCMVKGMAAIFTYGFQISEDAFKENACPLVTLSNYDALIKVAAQTKYIKKDDIESLMEWKKNPSTWKQE